VCTSISNGQFKLCQFSLLEDLLEELEKVLVGNRQEFCY